ncbi:RDD family protein [Isoptericola sp. NPDC057191]|uniref:RDD family protein n=1 Tax=Isoptericola sp. NPDC057191 TaxID=3346041 RepID=UPI0036337C36
MTSPAPVAPPPAPPNPPLTIEHALGPFSDERPRAAWGLRLLAVLLDSAVVGSVVFLATGSDTGLAALPGLGDSSGPSDDAAAAAWAAGTLLLLGALQAYTGMTPGKRVAGISVVDDRSGRPIGLPGTALRWFAHVLDAILLIGYIRAAFHREGRTFADSLLGTVAVRTTAPPPHPLVARLRAARDSRAPWLRWPRRVTGAVALVVCAAATAASITSTSGGSQQMSEQTSCIGTGDFAATAVLASSRDTRWVSRLGLTRITEQRWQVSVAWSTGLGIDADDNPDVGTTTAAVAVTSPRGDDAYTSGGPFGGVVDDGSTDDGSTGDVDDLGLSVPDEIASATVAVPRDPAGWTARAALMDEHGSVLAECSVPVPAIDADPLPDRL